MHAADLRMDPVAAQAVLEQFVALGYIQPQTENQEKAVASAVRECNYNLSRDLMDCRQHHALTAAGGTGPRNPKEMRFKLQLAQCYLSVGQNGNRKLLQEVLEFKPEKPKKEGAPAEEVNQTVYRTDSSGSNQGPLRINRKKQPRGPGPTG